MKNNKGFTLVELMITIAILSIVLLEIFAVMNNSSKLYLYGTYEIELQTEAQQVIQQMEELMIDADIAISTNYIPTISSDTVTISTNAATHVIELQKDPTAEFGNLVYSKLDTTGATVVNQVPMAEYVQSISVNFANYESASKVTLNVNMQNERYSYSSSRDIYLRNDIGLIDDGTGDSSDSLYEHELVALRYNTYNLSALYNDEHGGSNFIYRFEAGTSADYSLVKVSDSHYKFECKSSLNQGNATAQAVVEALDPVTNTVAFRILVKTDAVQFGADGYGVAFIQAQGGPSADLTSYIDILGLGLDTATVTYNIVMVPHATGQIQCSGSIAADAGNAYELVEVQNYGGGEIRFNLTDGSGICYMFGFDDLEGTVDTTTNSIVITSSLFKNYNGAVMSPGYYGYIKDGGNLYINVRLEFHSPDRTENVKIYLWPVNGANDDDAYDDFWGGTVGP